MIVNQPNLAAEWFKRLAYEVGHAAASIQSDSRTAGLHHARNTPHVVDHPVQKVDDSGKCLSALGVASSGEHEVYHARSLLSRVSICLKSFGYGS
jgi:hypothetical protein